ncbi:MAG: DNA polymerase IV [Clostridiales bacterium]|jgi:DNA polymerase-4|nr:DNA polymerase IV [Clostridiales bacterium]
MNTVAHIDANYYYGQIEALFRPEVRGKAFVVGGDQESRKGIVLTKSPLAKKFGIKTGVSIRDALNVYPKLIVIPANYPLYLYFSQRMREIVLQHTDTIKPFGSDEMWAQLYGDRETVRKTVTAIRHDIWKQLCLTVSVGIGNNLPYAKLGSDLAPNNGVCELWNDEQEEKVYPLPVSDLLYVGQATTEKFNRYGIRTIGDLARTDPKQVCRIVKNKTGESLWEMAVGQDRTTVASIESIDDIKSIGNSNTMPRDLEDDNDIRAAFYMLAESISERMRSNGFEATVIKISLKDNDLYGFTRQTKLTRPTNLTAELVPAAMALFKRHYRWSKPIRALGICGADLIPEDSVFQASLFTDEKKRQKTVSLERSVDRVRGRYGHFALQRAVLMHERLKSVNANNDIGDAPTFYSY